MEDEATYLVFSFMFILGLFAIAFSIASMLNHKFFFYRRDRFVLLWFIFVILSRLTLNLPYVIVSLCGGDFSGSPSIFALPASEYAKADARWTKSESSVVALELGAAIFETILAFLVVRGIVYNTVYRQFCQTCVSFMQVYRAWLVFGPEFVSRFADINFSNPVHVILFVVYNLVWTLVPLLILYETYLDASTGVMRYVTPYRMKSPVRSTKRHFSAFRNRDSWFWHS